jgi:hypothetical protein
LRALTGLPLRRNPETIEKMARKDQGNAIMIQADDGKIAGVRGYSCKSEKLLNSTQPLDARKGAAV